MQEEKPHANLPTWHHIFSPGRQTTQKTQGFYVVGPKTKALTVENLLDITIAEMIFIGDALFPGGNDYPAEQAGVVSIRVRDPDETKRLIETIIACLS
jgi:hypothetical protein